jgi:hypothetical protein
LTIVGIDPSAVGLNALNSFFDLQSADTGMAFVIITHLHHEIHHRVERRMQLNGFPTLEEVQRVLEDRTYMSTVLRDRRLDVGHSPR